MDLSRAKLENPERKGTNNFTEVETKIKTMVAEGTKQERKEFQIATYEYTAPFQYENFKVELGDKTKGAEFNRDGVELDIPPYGAITFVEEEEIVGVTVIGSSCCSPGTVYLHCEPVIWKYPRSGVKFKQDNLWGEHLRAYVVNAGITEQYKKCGMFSAYFSIPDSKKVTVMGNGAFDIEQRDYDTDHYDAHILIRMIRVDVKRRIK